MTLHITHNHRRYRLFKRSEEAGASFYLYFEERGERVLRSTGCADKAGATKWARSFIEARQQANSAAIDRLLARPGTVPTSTVDEFLNWFEVSPKIAVAEKSRTGYANCFRLVLRKADHADSGRLHLADVLTKNTVLDYLGAVTEEARAAEDQATAARVRRSAASILNQAKSVFSLLTVEHAQRHGLMLPPLNDFLHAVKIARKELAKGSGKDDFQPPDDAVIAATLAAWRALMLGDPTRSIPLPDRGGEGSRNAYAVIWLALSCGLRLAEIGQADWSWIIKKNGGPFLSANGATVKNGTGVLEVTPIDPFWSEGLATLGCLKSGPIITGGPTALEDAARAVSDLMTRAGWRTQKKAHALRALAGCYVCMKFGAWAAKEFLRHASITTTEANYLSLLEKKQFQPYPIEWAGQTTVTQ